MRIDFVSMLIGFGLAAVIASAAWKARSLNNQGALAALLLGTLIFGLGGLGWAILLIGFFVSSSVLSRLFKNRKLALEEKFSKGAQRDAAQVFANGGAAGLFVILHSLAPEALWPWVGFAGSLAAANADTWATELGVLSRGSPRLIISGRLVEPGTSGGVSGSGTAAAAGGALFIALLTVLFWQGHVLNLASSPPGWLAALVSTPNGKLAPGSAAWIAIMITLAGTAGSLLDSFLGATKQAIYWCPACAKETERHPVHICGCPTRLVRGWRWMNNDWVNLFCTLTGAALAIGLVTAGL